MIFLFENFAESRLHSAFLVGESQLEVPSIDAAKFPTPTEAEHRFALVLYDGIQKPEIVWATQNLGTGIIIVERGAEGTVPKTWRAGTAVINTPTKVSLNYLSSGGTDSWHDLLSARIDDAFAAISSEASIRETDLGVLADRIDTVSVESGNALAQAQNTASAFIGLQSAWSSYQTEVQAAVDEADARSRTAATAAVNAGQAVATLDTFVKTAVGDNAADFASRIESFTDFDEAQVQINTDISTRVGEVETGLSEEVLLRTTQFDAQVLTNTSISARLGNAESRITTEESVRAGETSALAGRATNIESEITAARGASANLGARIGLVESTAATATGAVAGRTATLEAQMAGTASSGVLSRIIAEEAARASADGGLATRTTSLEVTQTVSNYANLLLNTAALQGFRGWVQTGDFVVHIDAAFGSMWMLLGGATTYNYMYQDVALYDNSEYTLSWAGDAAGNPTNAFAYVQYFNSSNTQLGQSSSVDFSGGYWNARKSLTFQTPVGTAWVRVIFQKSNIGASYNMFFSRVMLNIGPIAAPWADTLTERDLGARITTEELARVNADNALASRTTTLEVKLPGGTSLTPNGNFENGTLEYWNLSGYVLGFNPDLGGWLANLAAATSSRTYPLGPVSSVWSGYVAGYSAQIKYRITSSEFCQFCIIWYSDDAGTVAISQTPWTDAIPDGTTRVWKIENQAKPANARTARVVGSVGPATQIIFQECKIERGAYATAYSSQGALVDSSARVVTAEKAIRNAGNLDAWWQVQAIAGSAMAGIRAKANSATGSEIGMVADGIALFNTILGVAEEVLKASGGNVYIRKKLILGGLGEIEFDPSIPAMVITVGSSRLCFGKIPNDGLVFWFGPSQATANMRKSNATIWMDTAGNAYWGGRIVAGTISNSIRGSNTGVPVSVSVGPFSTNGNPITIVWSYDYIRVARRYGNQTASGATNATVRLYQKVGTGAETLVDTRVITGTTTSFYDAEPIPGQPSGTIGYTAFTESKGGSYTYTDNLGGTAQRTYRVEVVARTDTGYGGIAYGADQTTQGYGITTSE